MNTDDLIASLAADTRRVTPAAPALRIVGALLGGGLVSFLAIGLVRGAPFGELGVTGVLGLCVKLLYATTMMGIAAALLLPAGRPGRRIGARWAWLLAPFLGVLVLASKEQAGLDTDARLRLMLGSTWQTCLASTVLLSLPVFVALLWAFRRLAPTRPGFTGFLAGFSSGAPGLCALRALLPGDGGVVPDHLVHAGHDGVGPDRRGARDAPTAVVESPG